MPDTAEIIELPTAEPAYNPVGPWRMQFRILKALILREMGARHGDSRLGYFMGILMPLATVGFMMLIFNLRGRIAPAEFPVAVFLATGFPVWLAFQRTNQAVQSAAARSDVLLAFPQITQLDLIIANATLDAATDTVVFAILIGIVAVLFRGPTADFPGVILCFWSALWMGVNFGLLLSAIRRMAPVIVTFINMFTRLLMWVSGVMFTVDRLPATIWPYLKWNPMLHIIEGLRHSWIPSYDPPIFDPKYIILSNLILTVVGLTVERATRKFVGE